MGREENVIERFVGAGVPGGTDLLRAGDLHLRFPGTPSELLGAFRTYYGPTMNAFEAAAADGREDDLHAELDELFNSQNTSLSEGATVIPATFLRVTVAV